MIDHISFNVLDFDRAMAFYKAALEPLGYRVVMEFPGVAGFGANGKPDFWLAKSEKAAPTHIAFVADRTAVDAFHSAAIAAGGTDNGAPGLRPQYHPNYYGAFVHDAEGNNIEAVSHGPPAPAKKASKRGAAKKTAKKPAAKKAPAKKAPAKKSAAKKTAKKGAAKKGAAKKAAAKKA